MPTASGNPTCPYVPTGTPVTAPDGSTTAYRPTATSQPSGAVSSSTAAGSAQPLSALAAAPGLGMANSPAENAWIAELVAPSSGLAPGQFPDFASLLLGPALRGSVVTVR